VMDAPASDQKIEIVSAFQLILPFSLLGLLRFAC
jgi:hypothetical protein